MTTKSILVPLDGSPDAEAALPWAVALAQKTHSSLRLVEVHAPPTVMVDGETLASSVVPDQAVRQSESEYLTALQARLNNSGIPVIAELLDGSVVNRLADYTRELKPAWVVMLSHARSSFARFFLGETAHEFVRQSASPVLLVQADSEGALPPSPSVQNVLVPLDGSELAEKMLAPATEFAKVTGAHVTLLMALDAIPDMEAIARRHEPGLPGPWDPSAAPLKAQLYLEHKADRIRAQSVKTTCKLVPHGDAADAIVKEAETPGTVVALATHGRGGLSKFMWGSVTDTVVRRVHCPALVFRPESA